MIIRIQKQRINSYTLIKMLMVAFLLFIIAACSKNNEDANSTPANTETNKVEVTHGENRYDLEITIGNDAAIDQSSITASSSSKTVQNIGSDNYTFPFGLVSFTITNLNPEGDETVAVQMTFPISFISDTKFFIVTPTGFEEIENVIFSTNQVTLILTDNGVGDNDNIPGQLTVYGGIAFPYEFQPEVEIIHSNLLTFEAGPYGRLSGDVEQTVFDGKNSTPVSAIPENGYRFKNWTGDYTGTANPLTISHITEDMRVTANFELDTSIKYSVRFTAESNGNILGDQSQAVVSGNDCTSVTAIPADGYHFSGWSGDFTGTANPLIVTDISSDMQIVANFKLTRLVVEHRQIAAGGYHTVLLNPDGKLYAMGLNSDGQLGDNTRVDKKIPVAVGSDNDWVAVAAGSYHTLALKADGTLWAWGNNQSGALGDGTTLNSKIPIRIGNDTDWAVFAGGHLYSIALKKDGTLWTWGSNSYGELGDGTSVNRSKPGRVGTDTDWVAVSAGGFGSVIAMKVDGTLWGWGKNFSGELGVGSPGPIYIPTQVGTDTDWAMINTGDYHTIALKTDGSLWTWGGNNLGQLGNGSDIIQVDIPVQASTDTDWIDIIAGYYHNLLLKSDGSFWGFGYNEYGQLGDGTWVDKNVPVKLGTDSDFDAVSAGTYHTIAIKQNNTFWAWGSNEYGQLGIGTLDDQYIPTKIDLN